MITPSAELMNSNKIGSFICLKKVKQIFIKIFYHIRYKYYQFQNLINHFPLGKGEVDRLELIDSIDKLRNKDRIKQ